MKKYPSIDANGRKIKVGDTVRIVGVPDLSGIKEEKMLRRVFGYLVGKYKKVREFDEIGNIELYFRIPKGRDKGLHFVWLESWLVKKKMNRGQLHSYKLNNSYIIK
jgi:hypothetical protein